MSVNNLTQKVKGLPNSPGIYIFKNTAGKIIYVGKAASLKDRVRSYFGKQNDFARPIDFYRDQITELEIKQTDTVLEAYFLEQDLIKRYQPKYNVLGKDDKSFVYVGITKEDFPRFEVKRKTDLEFRPKDDEKEKNKQSDMAKSTKEDLLDIQHSKVDVISKNGIAYTRVYGPYTARHLIEQALKILRKIFPYHNKPQKTEKFCLDYHIGLCPGPYAGKISKADYRKNIKAIELILRGKKKTLIRQLEKEMQRHSKKQEFEKAAQARNLLFTLRHIQDVAMIKESQLKPYKFVGVDKNQKTRAAGMNSTSHEKYFRVEGYDISNISGTHSVASMVVFDNEEDTLKPNKSQYRKFRIKTIKGANDVGAMQEVLQRRFANSWKIPNLILVDGGKGHLNMAKKVLRNYRYDIPILAVAKGPTRKKLDFYYYGKVPKLDDNIIAQIRDEAHRFAISYHRKLRRKNAIADLKK